MDKKLSKTEWKRKQRLKRYGRLGLVIALALIILFIALLVLKSLFTAVFSSNDTPAKRAEALKKQITIDETKNLLTKNKYSRPGTELKKVTGIVIHFVGIAGKTAKDVRDEFENLSISNEPLPESEKIYTSCHFLVGISGEIIQCIPTREVSHATRTRNEDTISIEYCHEDNEGVFNAETYTSLVTLTAYLMEKYSLETEQILRHSEAVESSFDCPKYFVDDESAWERFLSDVQKKSDESIKK